MNQHQPQQERKREILLSLLFFTLYMSQGAWLAFFNLYLESKGFSGSQIGIIGGLYQAAIFLFAPLIGMLGDRYGIKKLASISIMGSAVFLFFIQFIDQYLLLIIYTLVMASFTQPLGSLIDSLAITYVRNEKRSSFGQLRVWGSIGWAITTYLVGLLLANYSIDLIFLIANIISIFMLIILSLYNYSNPEQTSTSIKLSRYRVLLQNKSLLIFYLILIVYGIAVAPLYLFINLYFKEIGADYNIVGITFSLQALSEIPFFFFGNRLVKRFGAEKSILLSMIVTVLRMIFYGIISDPVCAVFVGLGQGLTLSLFLVSVIEYVHDIIPANLRATGQSLIWATHFGAGITIGNILTGNIYDTIGIKSVLIYDGLMVGIITAGLFFFFNKSQKLNTIN